jgi:hypothetical protein
MKIMNENGKHKLRRSDRIRKNVQLKLLEEDPYHYHKKQCKLFDVLERKISLLEERIQQLEQTKPEPVERPEEDEGFPWDVLFFLFGVVWLFYRYFPTHISVKYIYQPALSAGMSGLEGTGTTTF